jgi:hypothetical protein
MGDIPATPNIVWKTSTQSPGLSPIPPPSKSYVLARLICSLIQSRYKWDSEDDTQEGKKGRREEGKKGRREEGKGKNEEI